MAKKFNWKTFSYEQVPDQQFSVDPILPVPDGMPLPHNDPRIALLFSPAGVSREQAMKVSAVAKGRNAICQIANLPLVTYDKDNNIAVNNLTSQIAEGVPNVITLTRTVEDLLFDGRAYWVIDYLSRSTNYPTKAHHVPVGRVTENDGEFWVDGEKVDPDTVIKFESPNPALLEAMGDTVKRALLLSRTSEGYARNPKPQLVVRPAPGENVNEEAVKAAVNSLGRASAEHGGVVGFSVNLEAVVLAAMNPAELQLLEQYKQTYIEIANFFGLEPDEVGVPIGNDTYKNAQERRIAFKTEVLAPYVLAIEQRLSLGDVTPRGYFVRFNFDEFLRADSMEKAQVGEIEVRNGFITRDEYRNSKGLPPLTASQKRELQPASADTSSSENTEVEDGS
jgi:hypothetical protein